MVWTSHDEKVQAALTNYVAQLNLRMKIKLRHIYGRAINPFLGKWKTLNEVTFVNLRNRENVWSNLSLATLKEAIGLGP